MAIRAATTYFIANAVLDGILLIANSGLFFASLCVCRRLGDQARGFITWMKVSFLFMSGVLFFNCLTSVFVTLYYYVDSIGRGASNITSILDATLEMILKALLVATLGSLIRGILFARSSTPAKLATPARVGSFLLLGFVSLLSLVFLGLAIHGTYSGSISGLHANRIWGAIHIIIFVISLALLALSALTLVKVKALGHLRTASVVLIVASVFFFIHNLFTVIWIGLYGGLDPNSYNIPPRFSVIINFIFSTIPLFIVLVALFHLARGKGTFSSAPNTGLPVGAGSIQPAPGQYAPQPGAPTQGYPQYQYAQQPQAYAYGQPQQQQQPGQPAWQPGMYYYPQQQVPQGYAPQQIPQQPGYAPNVAQLPTGTPQPRSAELSTVGPNTISATSTPAPPSELGQGDKRQ